VVDYAEDPGVTAATIMLPARWPTQYSFGIRIGIIIAVQQLLSYECEAT
jgi:hypothetical protein